MKSFIEEIDFKQLVESSLTPTLILDIQQREILYANIACAELLAFKKGKGTFTKNFDSYLHPDFHEICKKRLNRVVLSKETAPLMEQKMIRTNGEVIDVEIMATPYIHRNKPMAQVLFRDITERKAIQNKVIQAEKLSLIGELASGIVHEIRNPLTSIKGFLQLLRDDFQNTVFADIVISELNQIEKIANELLYLSKPKEANRKLEDLSSIIEESIKLFDTEAFKNNIEINFNKNGCKEILVLGNRTQLKQVFLNLIKNAIEAISEKGNIHINTKVVSNSIYISIKDNGSGIPKDKIDKIGQTFFTSKDTGTGLGLMVTQNIINSHNGEVFIESEQGIGTVFTIRLPLKKNKLGA